MFYVLSIINAEWKKMILEEYIGNDFAQGNINMKTRSRGYVVKDGLILKRNQIFLILDSKVKLKVLHILHNAPLIDHP